MKRLQLFDSSALRYSREYYLARRPWYFGAAVWVYFGVSVFLVWWMYWFRIEEVARAPVVVRPPEARSVVRNPVAGQVVDVRYTKLTTVEHGDLLYRIDDREYKAQINALNRQVDPLQKTVVSLKHLSAMIAEALASHPVPEPQDGYETYPILPGDVADAVPAGIQREMSEPTATGLLSSHSGNTKLTADTVHRWQAFVYEDRRLATSAAEAALALQTEQAMPQLLSVATSLQTLEFQLVMRLSEWEAWRKTQLTQVLAEYRVQLHELNGLLGQRDTLAAAREQTTVTAPIAGKIIVEREVNISDHVSTDELILTIIPKDAETYRVQIDLQPGHMSGIHEGAALRIAFESLPPTEYGYISGTLTRVPPDTIVSRAGETFFRLEGSVPTRVTSRVTGSSLSLRPGMQGEARIIKRSKPILYFILELIDVRQ